MSIVKNLFEGRDVPMDRVTRLSYYGFPRGGDLDYNRVIVDLGESDDPDEYPELPQYQDEKNHSPDGFAWGYGGSGPSQLSYAILRHFVAEVLDMPEQFAQIVAENLYQEFKFDVIADFDQESQFEIQGPMITIWLEKVSEIKFGADK